MTELTDLPAAAPAAEPIDAAEAAEAADDLVDDDLLVEEISIDGMCGVY